MRGRRKKELPKKKMYAYISKLPKRISPFQLREFFLSLEGHFSIQKKKKSKSISVNSFRHVNFISLNLAGPWGSTFFRGPSSCLPNLSRGTHTHCSRSSKPYPLCRLASACPHPSPLRTFPSELLITNLIPLDPAGSDTAVHCPIPQPTPASFACWSNLYVFLLTS